jgi:ferritin-like metal-binding protein YciE
MPTTTRRTSKSKAAKAAPTATRTTRKKPKPAAKKSGKGAKPAAKKKAAPKVKSAAGRAKDPLGSLRVEREELLASVASAEARLRALNREAEELAALRREVEDARRELESLRRQAGVEGAVASAPDRAGPRAADELPAIPTLAAEERAADIRERLVRHLNDAWAVEGEQAELLKVLAEESGDRDVRALLAEHRAEGARQQSAVGARLAELGERPSGGRGLLGQLVTRAWEAMQKPGDQADAAVLALLKGVSAAECGAGVYAAAHAYARAAGDDDTASLAATHFLHERARAGRLRAALVPTVLRAARR